MRLNIHVIDDDEKSLRAIRSSLKGQGQHWQVHFHADEADYLNRRKADAPSCLILELKLAGIDGLDFQQRLRSAGEAPTIIFLTAQGSIPTVVQAMKQGAIEFLTKPVRPTELRAAVQQAEKIESIRWKQREEIRMRRQQLASLTRREREVFALVVAGYMNKVTAALLEINEGTVKIHRRHLMRKFSTTRLTELVRIAAMLGIKRSDESTDDDKRPDKPGKAG